MERWKCNKCQSFNSGTVNRCSFCNTPKTNINENVINDNDIKLLNTIHNLVEKMTPIQRRKLYRWMEDNIL